MKTALSLLAILRSVKAEVLVAFSEHSRCHTHQADNGSLPAAEHVDGIYRRG